MRIEAPTATQKQLTGKSERISNEEFWSWCRGVREVDASAVGWSDIRSMRAPQYFAFNATEHNQCWDGVMAVDMEGRRLYLYAEIL